MRDVRRRDRVCAHQAALLRSVRSQSRRRRERSALFFRADLLASARNLWRHRRDRGGEAHPDLFSRAAGIKVSARSLVTPRLGLRYHPLAPQLPCWIEEELVKTIVALAVMSLAFAPTANAQKQQSFKTIVRNGYDINSR